MPTKNRLTNMKVGSREHIEFSRLLVNTIQEYAIFLLDPGGKVVSWNPGAQKLKGYKPNEIIGKHFSIFYPKRDVETGKPELNLKIASEKGHVEDEGWRIRKDGTRFWASVVITALRGDDDELVGFAKVTRDLSERKKYEEELYQANLKLKRQSAGLQELNKSKDEFISLASHQLRTPASGVKQFLGLMLQGYAGDFTDQQREYLERANESNERQIELINDLLRVAQVDAGKVTLKPLPTEINVLIKDVVDEQKNKFETRQQKVVLALPEHDVVASVDPMRFRMVLENLIDNASKYTPEGGKITVKAMNREDTVLISVVDTGVGIDKSSLARLFQKFSRIPNHLSDSVGGSGLGLYWAYKIVKLHKGKISVDSYPNKGTTFTIMIPKEKQDA